AAPDRDLVGRVLQPVVAPELGADRLPQLGDAGDRRVLRPVLRHRPHRGVLDVLRRVEVWLAGAQPDHVAAGALELRGAGGHGDGRRRLHAVEAAGEDGHWSLLLGWECWNGCPRHDGRRQGTTLPPGPQPAKAPRPGDIGETQLSRLRIYPNTNIT